MTKHREILRMANLGLSQRNIAERLSCSRTTVAEVLRRARIEFALPLCNKMDNWGIAEKGKQSDFNVSKQLPHF